MQISTESFCICSQLRPPALGERFLPSDRKGESSRKQAAGPLGSPAPCPSLFHTARPSRLLCLQWVLPTLTQPPWALSIVRHKSIQVQAHALDPQALTLSWHTCLPFHALSPHTPLAAHLHTYAYLLTCADLCPSHACTALVVGSLRTSVWGMGQAEHPAGELPTVWRLPKESAVRALPASLGTSPRKTGAALPVANSPSRLRDSGRCPREDVSLWSSN